jgi:LacI family transcriptional regulator
MEHLKKLHDRGLPIVFFDRVSEEMKTHLVIVDNFKGAYEATAHLIQNGYKKIACLANSSHLSIAKERIGGYKQALIDNGFSIDETIIKYNNHGGIERHEIEKNMEELISLGERPDAVLGLSDKLTTGALRFLQHKGINVPNEMGLIGFSNSDLTELLNPSLSIIRQPALQMGKTAMELLLQLIESKRPTTQFAKKVLHTELIVRNSTKRTGSLNHVKSITAAVNIGCLQLAHLLSAEILKAVFL